MPVDKSSELWQNGETNSSIRQEVIDFLEEHDDQAYSLYELSDKLLDTHHAEEEEKDRLIEEIGRDEYYEQTGEEPNGFQQILERDLTIYLRGHMSALMYEDIVEYRVVPNKHLENRYEEGVTAFYSIR